MTFGHLLTDLLQGGEVTLEISVLAWILAAVLGLLVAIGMDLGNFAVRWVLSSFIMIFRSIPQLILLYLVYFGLGSVINVDPLLGAVLALGVADSAFMAEYYKAGFMTVAHAQREAGLSMGVSRFTVLLRIVIPQAIPVVTAPLLNTFVGLMKLATIASAVGVPEILYRGQGDIELSGRLTYVILIILVIYIVVTIPITRLVASLEPRVRRLVTG
jgi:His/Glu/Gln/Arg/opine family amino acid ABC transporter permease subunit